MEKVIGSDEPSLTNVEQERNAGRGQKQIETKKLIHYFTRMETTR